MNVIGWLLGYLNYISAHFQVQTHYDELLIGVSSSTDRLRHMRQWLKQLLPGLDTSQPIQTLRTLCHDYHWGSRQIHRQARSEQWQVLLVRNLLLSHGPPTVVSALTGCTSGTRKINICGNQLPFPLCDCFSACLLLRWVLEVQQ